MGRARYFLRAEPPERRVPPEIRARLIEALSVRFDAQPLDDWDGIAVTSMSWSHGSEANAEMHERLTALLDTAEPSWSDYFVLMPDKDAPWFLDTA